MAVDDGFIVTEDAVDKISVGIRKILLDPEDHDRQYFLIGSISQLVIEGNTLLYRLHISTSCIGT